MMNMHNCRAPKREAHYCGLCSRLACYASAIPAGACNTVRARARVYTSLAKAS